MPWLRLRDREYTQLVFTVAGESLLAVWDSERRLRPTSRKGRRIRERAVYLPFSSQVREGLCLRGDLHRLLAIQIVAGFSSVGDR